MIKLDVAKTIYFAYSSKCNAKCPFCDNWKISAQNQLEQSLKFLSALIPLKFKRIIFTGGEFVSEKGWQKLLINSHRLGLRIGIITNGTFFTEPFNNNKLTNLVSEIILSRDFPKSEDQNKMRGLNISDSLIENFFYSRDFNSPDLQINTILMEENMELLHKFEDLPFWKFVKSWHIIPIKKDIDFWNVSRIKKATRILNNLSKRFKKINYCFPKWNFQTNPQSISSSIERKIPRKCYWANETIYIDFWSNVYPCNSMLRKNWKENLYGKLCEDPESILQNRKLKLDNGSFGKQNSGCSSCDPLNVFRNTILENTSDE